MSKKSEAGKMFIKALQEKINSTIMKSLDKKEVAKLEKEIDDGRLKTLGGVYVAEYKSGVENKIVITNCDAEQLILGMVKEGAKMFNIKNKMEAATSIFFHAVEEAADDQGKDGEEEIVKLITEMYTAFMKEQEKQKEEAGVH